jgi:hypothetical protein
MLLNDKIDVSMMSLEQCNTTLLQATSQLGLITVEFETLRETHEGNVKQLCQLIKRLDRKITKLRETKVVGVDGTPASIPEPVSVPVTTTTVAEGA